MANWYTADLPFNHEKIITYCNRPFSSVEEMDRYYLTCLGEHLAPGDDLWIVGDFAFGRLRAQRRYVKDIFDSIPGRKHLVRGNHDGKWISELCWASLHDIAELRDGDRQLVLCHYPMLTWNRAGYGAIQLFGHAHGAFCGFSGCVNVGVDQWEHRPVQLDQIISRSKRLPANPLYSETS